MTLQQERRAFIKRLSKRGIRKLQATRLWRHLRQGKIHAERMTALELKELRERSGLTLGEVADLVGVFWVTVWRWENGKRRISLSMSLLLRDKLGERSLSHEPVPIENRKAPMMSYTTTIVSMMPLPATGPDQAVFYDTEIDKNEPELYAVPLIGWAVYKHEYDDKTIALESDVRTCGLALAFMRTRSVFDTSVLVEEEPSFVGYLMPGAEVSVEMWEIAHEKLQSARERSAYERRS